jgi:hypothetical protein
MAEIADEVLEDWIAAFEALPEDRREDIEKWFATQKIIIEASGLEPETWFGYVEWALDHPFDYSFIQDFPETGAGEARDAAERTDATRRSRELVGGATRVTAPDGDGMKGKAKAKQGLERELFDNFMKNRLGGK